MDPRLSIPFENLLVLSDAILDNPRVEVSASDKRMLVSRKGSRKANIIQLGRLAKLIELVVTNGTEVLCVYSFVLTHGFLFLLLKFVRQESPMEPTLMR